MPSAAALAAFDANAWLDVVSRFARTEDAEAALTLLCEAIQKATPWQDACFLAGLADGLVVGCAGVGRPALDEVRSMGARIKPAERARNRARVLELHRLAGDVPAAFVPEGHRAGLPDFVLPGEGTPGDAPDRWRAGDELVLLPDDAQGASLGMLALGRPSHGNRPDAADLAVLRALSPWVHTCAEILATRERARASGREASQTLLRHVESLTQTTDVDEVIHRLAQMCAGIAGYRSALLTVYLDDGPRLGAWNLTEVEREGFERSMRRTTRARSAQRRQQIRRFLFPGTEIAYVPADADVERGSGFVPSREPGKGSWHPEDRLFILMRGPVGQEMGVLSLDEPLDGDAPTEDSLGGLPTAERMLSLGASLLEARTLNDQVVRAHRLEALGTLAAGVAHDFNNTIGVVMGYASLLEVRAGEDEKQREVALALQAAAERAADLTDRLRTLARVEGEEREAVDMGHVLAECAATVREASDESLRVETQVSEIVPVVLGDATQLQRCVLNLALNARDALGGGPGAIRLSAVPVMGDLLGDTTDGPWVEVLVEDDGPGIDESVRDRIFEPFFTTKGRAESSGLGLFLSWNIVKAHGGTIEAGTSDAGGARLRILLPGSDPSALHADDDRSDTDEAHADPVPPTRVLVVEDEPMMQMLVVEAMEMAGHTCEVVGDGQDAIDRLVPDAPYGLVVLDLVLPGRSGLDVLRHMQVAGVDTPVLVSSGNAEEGLSDPVLRGRVDAVIEKPWRIPDLRALADRVLRRRG